MFHVIEAHTADEVWIKAAKLFLPGGTSLIQEGRGGQTAEVLHVGLTISDPRQRWIGSRDPAMSPAFAIAEVIWIICGRNDSAFLNYFNSRLSQFQGKGKTYDGAYGFRLRNHFEIDQLNQAFEALQSDSESRQIVLQIWDVHTDFPNKDGSPRSSDIPCNIVALLKVRNGKLEWTQIMRSNDLFRGLPHNVVQFTTLQEVVAGWLGLEVGDYHHYSDSLHFYVNDGSVQDHIKLVDLVPNPDSLALPKMESENAFKILSNFAERIILPETSVSQIIDELAELSLSKPFFNLAAILAAEGLRRRKAEAALTTVLMQCSNPCLQLLFKRWVQRLEVGKT